MKKIQWPSKVLVPIDRELGRKLDEVCRSTHLNRPGALRRGIELLHEQEILIPEREVQSA